MTDENFDMITILPGKFRDGMTENFDAIEIRPGDTISIVGPTGSGKSALINDIEIFANYDTITNRKILINGVTPPEEYIRDPAKKPVALITQNNRCLCDLTVAAFLNMHIRSRRSSPSVLKEAIDLANQFTGEPIAENCHMTELSGGQTRALMIADAILISDTPIILLDEVENAGIFKEKVIETLCTYHKSLIFVTHDPLVSLLSDRRIVMKNGGVVDVILPNGSEQDAINELITINKTISDMRELIRSGKMIRNTNSYPVIS